MCGILGNIFVPQSLQTQVELEEIAAVERQLIDPGNSKTVLGIVQDGLLGAYNLTSPTVRIDWRSAMNIMSYTSLEDFSSIKKDKDYSGAELFSLIVPGGINLNKGSLKIKNGKMLEGRLTKDALGAKKKNNLVQLIWDAYGVDKTRKFVDDTQRLINNFNLWHGFSVGIGDTQLPDSVHDEMNKMFQSRELKVDHIITNMENNPDLMKYELYEFQLFSELNIIREDINKLVISNLSPSNSFQIMASSGSKGDATNSGQMCGCLGLQVFEGKIMPKKYNGRTLAYFHQHDDRGPSRGLIKQSFARGLEYPQYVFHLMAARLSIIEQAIKSVSGDTPLIIQEGGETMDVNIGDWIDKLMKDNKNNVVKEGDYDMESLELKNDVYIPTCDENGTTSWGKVTSVTRHDPTKEMYKVTTYGGREVICADSKSLLIWDSNKNEFVPSTPMNAKVGDFVPVTATLGTPPIINDYIDTKKYFLNNDKYLHSTDFGSVEKQMREKEQFSLTRENGVFIGLYLADGNYDIPSGYVQITKNNKSIQTFVSNWFEKNGIKHQVKNVTQIEGTFTEIRGHSRMLGDFLTALVGHGSENKYVPNEAYSAPDEFVKGLLDGYFSGNCDIDDAITVTSASRKLIEGISMLCNRMGVFGRLTVAQAKKNNIGTNIILPSLPSHAFNIRSQWAQKFKQQIKLTHNEKNKSLESIAQSSSYRNLSEYYDIVFDKIESITKVNTKEYKKLYDMTVPSTLNFGGRGGMIYRDTAETGYTQRKLVKSMEDIMVKYDNTVRSANNGIIQFVYGDSGADTTKQNEYTIKMIESNNQELEATHKFSPQELKNYKGFTETDNNKLFKDIMSMRDLIRESLRKAKIDYIVLVNTFMIPVNLTRIIDTIAGLEIKSTDVLTPQYVTQSLENILTNAMTNIICMSDAERNDSNSFKIKDEKLHKTIFRTALYDLLSPKKVLLERKLNKKQFDTIIEEISANFNRNMIEPGEMAGVIAAQSTGEPLTQMSVQKNELILIRNVTTKEIYYGKIGEFIDKLLTANEQNVKKVEGHKNSVVLNTQNFEIMSISTNTFNETNSWKTISQVSRHPSNGNLIKVQTKSGRHVTTTKSHSHLKKSKTGIIPVEGKDLKKGDRIPVAKYIPTCSNPLKNIQVGELNIKLDNDFGWFCGVYLADGHINYHTIAISKVIKEYQNKVSSIVKKLFGYDVKLKHKDGEFGNSETQVFTDKNVSKFLKNTFDVGSYEKDIPSFVFASNIDFIKGLLCGYFDGDGNVQSDDSNHHSIRVSSRSKKIIDSVALLFSYLGIFGSILQEKSKNIPGEIQYNYSIQKKYAQFFKDNIKLCVPVKVTNLDKMIVYNNKAKHCHNDFNDMIPELGEVIAETGKVLNIKGHSELYGRFARENKAIGRITLQNIYKTFEDHIKNLEDIETKEKLHPLMNKLKFAIDSNVVWDKIVKITEIKDPKEFVYDFSVPTTESFMVNSGVLIHNTLNSFHHSGMSTLSSQLGGVPRIRELFSTSKKPKSPSMFIYFAEEFAKSKDMAHKIASHIKHTTLGEVRGRINVYYDPQPQSKGSIMERDNIKQVFHHNKGSRTGCQSDINGLPWLIRIELDREKMLEKEVLLIDVVSKFCSWWEKRFSENKQIKKEEKKVLNKITQMAVLSNTDNDKYPVVHVRFNVKDADKDKDRFDLSTIDNFIDHIIDTFKLKGINGISDIPTIHEERAMVFNKENGNVDKTTQYVVHTAGVNLTEIRYLNGINLTKTISNNVIEMYNTFGIEIARAVLLREIFNAYEKSGGEVNCQHVSMIVDQMTATGQINSIDRHGMNKSDNDPLSRASFEKTVEQLLIAAVYGETDHMKGVSSRIMVGAVVEGGTGYCGLELDTEMIEKSEYLESSEQTKKFTELNKGTLADDIIKKKEKKNIFIPE